MDCLLRRCLLFLFCWLVAFSQDVTLNDLQVEKKPGEQFGRVTAVVNGKTRRVVSKASAAWTVNGRRNILAIVPPRKNYPNYHLRFYEGATGKSRSLGDSPILAATLLEQEAKEGREPVFVLSGTDSKTNQPVVLAADPFAIRSILTGATQPKIEDGNLIYTRDGQLVRSGLDEAMARDRRHIYRIGGNTPFGSVQFLEDGSAVMLKRDGGAENGRWWTDGPNMIVARRGQEAFVTLPKADLSVESGVPAGTRLVVRLTQPLSSHKATAGSAVEAVLVSPAVANGQILIPSRTKLTGTLVAVTSVGWGVKKETAALTVEFTQLVFPEGRTEAFTGRLLEVENSRESVDDKGSVKGVRATGTLGYTAKGQISSVAAVDPISYIFTNAAGTAVLGFAEPEILYPAGTELQVLMTVPLISSHAYPRTTGPVTASAEERATLTQLIEKLPFRTMTQGSNKPSDITNLLFIGNPAALRRAFDAAGWTDADTLTAESTFQTMKTITGNSEYTRAPMSTLLLDEREPIYTLSKTTNTFASRHHLRIFDPAATYEGAQILTSSSTQDIGIAFSRKKKTFIHVIDEYIDNERSKVVNDLEFTGCVEATEMIARPWVPLDAYNSTGDRLRTDGAIAVLRINDCLDPRKTPTDAPLRPSRMQRGFRNTVLSIRNDLYRGNLGYQGYFGARKLYDYLSPEKELKPDAGAWHKSDIDGTHYEGFGSHPAGRTRPEDFDAPQGDGPQIETGAKVDRWRAPLYEISLSGGYMRYPSQDLETVAVVMASSDLTKPFYYTGMDDGLRHGWAAALSVTLNSWRWVSNEFTYAYHHGRYHLNDYTLTDAPAGIDEQLSTVGVGLITRQVEYNVLVHARPRESRWRPYIAAGPALQLMSISGAPMKRAAGPFHLGLQNIGIFKAAFDFGRTPPLEGGGVFQMGLQWGGGLKFRAHPRIMIRADYRQTWSKNPRFIRESYLGYDPDTLDASYDTEVLHIDSGTHFFNQRFTVGIGFTF